MLDLDPAKLMVILVVGLIVLGPERLPQLAKKTGSLWADVRRLRKRLEDELRGSFPDLPPTHEVARAVRSPVSLLNRLADAHEKGPVEDHSEAPTTGRDEEPIVDLETGPTAAPEKGPPVLLGAEGTLDPDVPQAVWPGAEVSKSTDETADHEVIVFAEPSLN